MNLVGIGRIIVSKTISPRCVADDAGAGRDTIICVSTSAMAKIHCVHFYQFINNRPDPLKWLR
jgi:hypothetical protein